ncbi:MAG: hypothetical protein V1758_11225 [Pseudomonadota bacterium]
MASVGLGQFLITSVRVCKLSLRNPACGGAEERRLRRMRQYAARPLARRAYAPEGGASEGNAADDALMVDQAGTDQLTHRTRCPIVPRK